MSLELSIIIPTCRPAIVNDCLSAIYKNTSPTIDYEVIFISPMSLEINAPMKLKFLRDVGESKYRAIQQGVEAAQGNYIWTIADYHLPTYHCVDNLLQRMYLHKNELYITSPRFQTSSYEDNPAIRGEIRPECHIENIWYARCPMIHKEWIAPIGGFMDTYYKHSHGDPDLSFRVLRHKGKVELCPEATVIINEKKNVLQTESDRGEDDDKFNKRWMREGKCVLL